MMIPGRPQKRIRYYGMDFADALHLSVSPDCRAFYTFDQKLVRKAKNRGRCAVMEP